MAFLTFFLLTSSILLKGSLGEINAIVQKVITQTGYEIEYQDENSIITKVMEINIKGLNNFIIEEFPDENPGWTQARVQIFVKLRPVETQKTEIEINAVFERFGTPSALLLIPPHWCSVASNGNLEKELLDKINETISNQEEK